MSDNRFAFAVRAYVKEKNNNYNMVTKMFCWHSPLNSFKGTRLNDHDNIFVFEAECYGMQLQHMQFMAMCDGPDIADGMNVLMYGPNIKDIHITTGRLPLLDLLEGRSSSMSTSLQKSNPVSKSESFDMSQPEVHLILETCKLPENYLRKYQSMNAMSLKYIKSIHNKLETLDQGRVDKLNEDMCSIAIAIHKKGFKYHTEGILAGSNVTVWNNTVDLSYPFIQRALDNKIEKHFAHPADSFGLVMTCLKICGIGIHEKIDSNVAERFARTFPCYISTAITYSSDLKKNAKSQTFVQGEDIGDSMGDNVYDDKNYISLKSNQMNMKGLRRSYHDSIFFDDCEGDATILKICYGMAKKLCETVSKKSKSNSMQGIMNDIKSASIMSDWSMEEVKSGLSQCAQLYEHIKNTNIDLLLMSAKAPNVETSTLSDGTEKQEITYDICGHCAAMVKHNGQLYLAEMTAPVYLLPSTSTPAGVDIPESDFNMIKKSYNKAIEITKKMSKSMNEQKVDENIFYSQLRDDIGPTHVCTKTWMHMKKIDGQFWHIGGVLGDKMLVGLDGQTLGVPVSDIINPENKGKINGVNVQCPDDKMREFDFISTCATPPILPCIKIFQQKILSLRPNKDPT
eukprot:359279-Hanusia_phi.AAC.5